MLDESHQVLHENTGPEIGGSGGSRGSKCGIVAFFRDGSGWNWRRICFLLMGIILVGLVVVAIGWGTSGGSKFSTPGGSWGVDDPQIHFDNPKASESGPNDVRKHPGPKANPTTDPVSFLYEAASKGHLPEPTFETTECKSGKINYGWIVSVSFNGGEFKGFGVSKRAAKKVAFQKAAFKHLNMTLEHDEDNSGDCPPPPPSPPPRSTTVAPSTFPGMIIN